MGGLWHFAPPLESICRARKLGAALPSNATANYIARATIGLLGSASRLVLALKRIAFPSLTRSPQSR